LTYQRGVSRTEDACLVSDYLGRITQAGNGASARRWELDGNSNILKRSDAGQAALYQYAGVDSNQGTATTETRTTFDYDANGNITSVARAGTPILNLAYSRATGRVQTIAIPSGDPLDRIDLLYDPSGVRTLKTSNGKISSQLFRMSSQNSFLETLTGLSGATAVRHVPAPGVTVVYTNGGFYFALQDRLGSTRILLSSAGKIAGQYSYDVYGMPAILQPAPFPYSCLFTGQHYDAEVGLYDFRARLYDPQLQRFYSPDPVRQFFSPYVYAGCNPVLLIDPTGESADWLAGIFVGIGAVLGGIALTVLTGGIGGVIGAGLIAAGVSSIYYAASQRDNFKFGEWGALTGLGFGFGLLAGGGAAVAGVAFSSSVAVGLADVTMSTGLGAADQVVNNGVLNVMNDRSFLDDAVTSAEFGAAAGFGFGVLGAGLGRGLGYASRRALREAGANTEVSVGMGQGGGKTAHSLLRLGNDGYHILWGEGGDIKCCGTTRAIRTSVWNEASVDEGRLGNWPRNHPPFARNLPNEATVRLTPARVARARPVVGENTGEFSWVRNNCVINAANRLDLAGLRAPFWARRAPTLLYWWFRALQRFQSW